MRSLLMSLFVALPAGCSSPALKTDAAAEPPSEDPLWEGRYPGECSDGADNDGDGAFDCNDTDCAGSPDCAPDEASDDTGDPGDDTDDDEAVLATQRQVAWEQLLADTETWMDMWGIPGVAFAVVLDGELAFATGMGTTTYGSAIPVQADTVFRWNSVSKLHTGLALLQAAEEGLVDLDAPVTTYVPEVTLAGDYDADSLTVRRAMSHTSALPDVWDTDCTVDLRGYWRDVRWGLHAEDARFFNYSNTGWSLAGRVLEAVTSESFADRLHDRVLTPAGMTTASFRSADGMSGSYAIGYDGYDYYIPDLNECPAIAPAGGLHGSVLDLARMASVLLGGGEELLGSDAITALTDEVSTYFSPEQTYGLGLYKWSWNGLEVVSHSGYGGGQRSSFVLLPSQNLGVVVVTNATYWDPYTIADRALSLFAEWASDTEEPELATSPSEWSAFTGTYEDALVTGTILVSQASDGKLYIRFEDGTATDRLLYQHSPNQFFYLYEGYNYVRFVPDEAGTVRWLANRYFVGTRVDVAAAGAPAPIEEVTEVETSKGESEARTPWRPPSY